MEQEQEKWLHHKIQDSNTSFNALPEAVQYQHCYKLDHHIFSYCQKELGMHCETDGLASCKNKQLKSYVSRQAELNNFATDLFSLPKEGCKKVQMVVMS